ncbi:MAG: aminotransferase class I/II-fold pyridoxal phosphate-dependent enzyme [Actinomycetota bacterium]|nr:aminotransferase class I/II-fold pyridoxal phosphate-dependent enzyme [Actinomycetota bacterium]
MVSSESSTNGRDIAIVGMGCRFPGARNINEYWRLLRDPEPQFAAVPDSRWRRDSFLSDDFRDLYSTYTDTMALLNDVGAFDAAHYKIPPRRAKSMDPQHRVLIDLAREAIQDAGWEADGFDSADTSVIMALSESGYREISTMNIRLRQLAGGEFGRPAPEVADTASAVGGFHGTALAGLLLNMGPSAVSSVFDLGGESYALDAACSGGLAAVAIAVTALRAGRCRIAIAGGAQLVLTPDLLIGLCRIGAISPSGQCRPFDVNANGFVLGEGAGVLVLRPLADAEAAGDRVYAVIRGAGTSNDGMVKGGMTPQRGGQLLALRRAYADAGLPAGAVDYIEAHGTGTTVGDRVEVAALRELRGADASPAYLGAVKAVVGHSLGTSGIAGLIKTVLSVHKGQIVPQPDTEPAGHLGLEAARLRIPTSLTEWPTSGPRRAGVSAFGFGGTNVHLVLEEAATAPVTATSRAQMLVLSARDRPGLATYARAVANTISADALKLAEVAATLARRSSFTERLVIVADGETDAITRLVAASKALDAGHTGELRPGAVASSVSRTAGHIADLTASAALSVTDLSELARATASGAALRVITDRLPPCTLPPSPLSPRRHWIVDETKLVGGPIPELYQPEPSSMPQETPDVSDVFSVVLEEVARTSAFPVTDLQAQHCLVADLGFDSLMTHSLEVNLRKRFPLIPIVIDVDRGLTIDALVSSIDPDCRIAAPSAAHRDETPFAWNPATARIDEFPEVAALDERLRQVGSLGLPNPYFRVHEGNPRGTTKIGERTYISFSSYNYLGLSGHPRVNAAAHEAVERYGTSVSASRLLAGERQLTRSLERELAALVGAQDCVTLVSGHATNVTAIGHLAGADDLIVHDALAHDSILQGSALSGATRRPFAHNDYEQLEHILRRTRSRFRRVLVAVEGAYSMDGDLADLPHLIELKKRYGALLFVDEAHSIGTVGAHGGGVGEFFDVDRSDVDLWMGTLSKSLASCGGYLAGSAKVVNWLKYTLPGFVYSVGLTPANAAAALAAIELMRDEPHRLIDLRANTELFLRLSKEAGAETGMAGHSPIVPCVVGDSAATLRLATALFDGGIAVDPILHPAVDETQTRLRFFLTSEHTEHEIRHTVSTLATALQQRAFDPVDGIGFG